MIRRILTVCGIFILFLLQSSVFSRFSLGGIVPNLLLVFTVVLGLYRGEMEGMLIGFFSGLLMDVFCGDIIGFYALLFMIIGYLCGKFCGLFFPEDLKLPIALIFVSNFSYGILCYIFLFLMRGKIHFLFYFIHIILPEVFYTLLASIVLYPLLLFLEQALTKGKKRSERNFV